MTEQELYMKVHEAYANALTTMQDYFFKLPQYTDLKEAHTGMRDIVVKSLIKELDLYEVFEDSERMDLADRADVQMSLFGEFLAGGNPKSLRCALDNLRKPIQLPANEEEDH